jgi:hypothetical protein
MPGTVAIAIVCKAPKPGSSKTRLIPSLGPDRAAALARAFLVDLAATIEGVAAAVACKGYAVCSPESAAAELATFLPPGFGYVVQTDPVLGRVLDGAVGELLSRGHESAILVNGDSPTLPADLLVEAVMALREPGERAVFAPALDGGYTFVGLKRRTPELFDDVPWSTPAVLQRSLEQAKRHKVLTRVLAPWYDIDDAESLGWLVSELRGDPPAGLILRGAAAPCTRRVLDLED